MCRNCAEELGGLSNGCTGLQLLHTSQEMGALNYCLIGRAYIAAHEHHLPVCRRRSRGRPLAAAYLLLPSPVEVGQDLYLLVLEGDFSSLRHLSRNGSPLIGRSPGRGTPHGGSGSEPAPRKGPVGIDGRSASRSSHWTWRGGDTDRQVRAGIPLFHGESPYCFILSTNVRSGMPMSCAARVWTPPVVFSASYILRRSNSRSSSAMGRNV